MNNPGAHAKATFAMRLQLGDEAFRKAIAQQLFGCAESGLALAVDSLSLAKRQAIQPAATDLFRLTEISALAASPEILRIIDKSVTNGCTGCEKLKMQKDDFEPPPKTASSKGRLSF
jgi:hypothetical protein